MNGKTTTTKYNRFMNFNVIYNLHVLWSSRNLEIIYVMCCSIRRGVLAGIAIEEINDDDPLLPDTNPSRVSHNVIMSTCRLPSMYVVITYIIHMCHIYIYEYVRQAYASRLVKGFALLSLFYTVQNVDGVTRFRSHTWPVMFRGCLR